MVKQMIRFETEVNCRTYESLRILARPGSSHMVKILRLFQNVGSRISRPIRRKSQSGSCSAYPRTPNAQLATTSVVYRAHSSFISNSAPFEGDTNTVHTIKCFQ